MAAQITLYGNKASPFSEKVELALREGNIPYKYYEVDLGNKPAFFVEKINPVGKVPAITYGGPDVPTLEDPSPLSFKLAESDVILEFVADLYPEARLLPTDPVQRAKVRFFMQAVSSRLFSPFETWVDEGTPEARENLLKGIAFIQGLLPESARFAVGESYTIADACITPFIHQLQICIEYDFGEFPVGGGPELGETLKDPKYAKFMAYVHAATSRRVSKELFIPENVTRYLSQVYRTT